MSRAEVVTDEWLEEHATGFRAIADGLIHASSVNVDMVFLAAALEELQERRNPSVVRLCRQSDAYLAGRAKAARETLDAGQPEGMSDEGWDEIWAICDLTAELCEEVLSWRMQLAALPAPPEVPNG